MVETIRSASMRINRPRGDGQAQSGVNDVFGEGFSLQGVANNIVMANIVPGVSEDWGPIGPVNKWDFTVSISDFSFDNFMMNQVPMALGPGTYEFDVMEFMDFLIGEQRQRVRYQVAGILLPEHGPFDRANRQNRSRPTVIKPTKVVIGGGSSIHAHRDGIVKPEHGVAGDQYPFAYCDMRGGPAGEAVWITRLPGRPAVQHLPLRSM